MDTQPLALPVDYYDLLNLAPVHLFRGQGPAGPRGGQWRPFQLRSSDPSPDDPLTPAVVDMAAARAEQAVAGDRALSPGARDLRLAEIELGRRILRDEDRRRRYDALRWPGAGSGAGAERLRRLRELQLEAQAEIDRERGRPAASGDGEQLLAEGLEALRQADYPIARSTLRRAAGLLPGSAEAQLAYVRAAFAAEDPLALGAFALRGLAEALERARAAAPGHPAVAPLARLVAGLIDREAGDRYGARQQLEEAARLQPNLAPAWRGLAAVHLAEGRHAEAAEAARRAFEADERDEAPLHILVVAAARAGQASLAHAGARRIAAMRGHPWTPERVLRELGV